MNYNNFIFFAPYDHNIKKISIENESLIQILKDKFNFTNDELTHHFDKTDYNGRYHEIRSFNSNVLKFLKSVKNKNEKCMNDILDTYLHGGFGEISKDLLLWVLSIYYKPTGEDIRNPKKFDITYAFLANNDQLINALLSWNLKTKKESHVLKKFAKAYQKARTMLQIDKDDSDETKELKTSMVKNLNHYKSKFDKI